MKSIFLLTAILSLTSCVNLKGVLTTHQTMSFKTKKKTIHVSQGAHKATIKFKSKKKLQLVLTKGRNKKINFTIPGNVTIPRSNGEIFLTAAQTGQSYDLHGEIDTEYRSGPSQVSVESCSITRRVKECVRNDQGQRECRMIERTIEGRKRTRYHMDYQDKDLFVTFNVPNSAAIAAKFHGTQHTSNKVIERVGPCRTRRRL